MRVLIDALAARFKREHITGAVFGDADAARAVLMAYPQAKVYLVTESDLPLADAAKVAWAVQQGRCVVEPAVPPGVRLDFTFARGDDAPAFLTS